MKNGKMIVVKVRFDISFREMYQQGTTAHFINETEAAKRLLGSDVISHLAWRGGDP